MTAIHRPLPDGGSYELCAPVPGYTALTMHDADGDRAVVTFDRGAARHLIDDLTLIAGLAPTAPQLGRAAALAGSARVLFERLRELKRDNPAGADMIVAMIVADLRSWDPVSLLTSQVAP